MLNLLAPKVRSEIGKKPPNPIGKLRRKTWRTLLDLQLRFLPCWLEPSSHDLLDLHDLHDGLSAVCSLHDLHNHHGVRDLYDLHKLSKGDVTILDLDIASLAPDLRPPRSLPHIGPTSQDSSAESLIQP